MNKYKILATCPGRAWRKCTKILVSLKDTQNPETGTSAIPNQVDIMEQKNIVKRYKKDDLTIVWQPGKCIHSAVCVKMLPKVYDPNAKPWIQPENATVEQLRAQIDKCPSGALSYEMDANALSSIQEGLEVEIMENGPILVKGKLNITYPSGETEMKDKTTAFCRCGASANKPYCDGAHRKIEFRG